MKALSTGASALKESFVAKTVASGELPYYERRCRFIRICTRLNQRSCPQRSMLGVNECLKILQSGTRRGDLGRNHLLADLKRRYYAYPGLIFAVARVWTINARKGKRRANVKKYWE